MMHLLFGFLPLLVVAIVAGGISTVERSLPGRGWGRLVLVGGIAGLLLLAALALLPAAADDTLWEIVPGTMVSVVGAALAVWFARKPWSAAGFYVALLLLVPFVFYTGYFVLTGPGDGSGFEGILYLLSFLYFGLPALVVGVATGLLRTVKHRGAWGERGATGTPIGQPR